MSNASLPTAKLLCLVLVQTVKMNSCEQALRNRDECSLNELANLRQRIDELERIVKEGRTSWIPGMSILRSFEETTEITSPKVLPPPRTSKTTETSPNSIPKNL